MNFNFDEIIPRRNSNSIKWDFVKDDDVLPMWVADMDFRTAPPIIEALTKRAQHGIFGYTKVPDAYFDAVIGWFERRHGFKVQRDWILVSTSVVPAISAIIKALTTPGDQVIIQSPVYNCFYSSIRNNECETVSNDLIYNDGDYSINFEELEKLAANPKAKLLLFCSPHNPAGRVWTKDELKRVGDICIRNSVIVISDEIHCDLVFEGHKHIPFATLGDEYLQHSITCVAPSKTFNTANLHTANIFAADPEIRKRIDKALNVNEVCEIGAFGVDGLIAAYNDSEEWLNQLIKYLHGNYIFLKNFFDEHLPFIKVTPLQATYLVWIDCSALGKSSNELGDMLLINEKLLLNKGIIYGANGDSFLRINIACPRALLIEGLNKIKNAFTTNN